MINAVASHAQNRVLPCFRLENLANDISLELISSKNLSFCLLNLWSMYLTKIHHMWVAYFEQAPLFGGELNIDTVANLSKLKCLLINTQQSYTKSKFHCSARKSSEKLFTGKQVILNTFSSVQVVINL